MIIDTSLVEEIIENGKSIKSVESSIRGLEESLDLLDDRAKSKLGKPSTIHKQIMMVSNQLEIMENKLKNLIERREELSKYFNSVHCPEESNEISTEAVLDIIDEIIINLLKIDDEYMEVYRTSNPSIMAFVESLLEKKQSLLKDK